jgi:hypothetical protein
MVAVQSISRLVDGGHNIADYLARKLAPAHPEALFRVVILEMSMVLHARQEEGQSSLYSVLRSSRYSPQAVLMLECDRSLATHRTPTGNDADGDDSDSVAVATKKKMDMKYRR